MIGLCGVGTRKSGGYPPYVKTVKLMIANTLEAKYSKDWL
jgi:hypothetical protein